MNRQINEYKHFEQIYLEVLNTLAPIKRRLLRANHFPYITKAFRKAIIKGPVLENKYVKNKTDENLKSLSDKVTTFRKISLIEKGEII